MPKSTGEIEVFCSAGDFLSVITDFEKYPEFISEMKTVEVLDRSDDSARVRFVVEVNVMGQSIASEYTVDYTIADDSVSWTLVESENLTVNQGSWKVEAVDDDECEAHYEAELETNLPIPASVQKMFADQEMPKLLGAFRERAEDLYD